MFQVKVFKIITLFTVIIAISSCSNRRSDHSIDEMEDPVEEGKLAPDFTKVQPDGSPFTLSTLRGKYVLVDFWGSWCRPCRVSHPELKKMYETFKDQGFEIVGVAQEGGNLERARKTWLKAIEEDEITWIQVLNDEGQDELDVVDLYEVNVYPTKVLIDPEGIVLYRGIGSGDSTFMKKINAIFSAKN